MTGWGPSLRYAYPSDIDPSVVEDVISKIAKAVVHAGMGMPAILFFSSVKPLTLIGSTFGKAIVAPLIGLAGYQAMEKAELYLTIFESRDNVDRLIKKIEELSKVPNQPNK